MKKKRKNKKCSTPSFTCELPLKVSLEEERELLIRLDCARQVYNAVLGVGLKRLRNLRSGPGYREYLLLPKGKSRDNGGTTTEIKQRKLKTQAYSDLLKKFQLSDYDLQGLITTMAFGKCWVGERLGTPILQKLATRAFNSIKRYMIQGHGEKGKPRFKKHNQFDSVEGKDRSCLVLKDGYVFWKGGKFYQKKSYAKELKLEAVINRNDPVIRHGIESPLKYLRLVRRKIRGRNRFYVQLLCGGSPFQKPKNVIGKGVVGLDFGPKHFAFVSNTNAVRTTFCSGLNNIDQKIRRLQRMMDRSKRCSNLNNFDDKGRAIVGKRSWIYSNSYKKLRDLVAELQRKQAEQRKSLQGQLQNKILVEGNDFRTEAISYKSWQKQFGKSVNYYAPSMFVNNLKRKAESAGASLQTFSTRTTKLSRTCICGNEEVKLGKGYHVHHCPKCGVGPYDRDVFSAWLARFVDVKNSTLDLKQAKLAWISDDSRLRLDRGEFNNLRVEGATLSTCEKSCVGADQSNIPNECLRGSFREA